MMKRKVLFILAVLALIAGVGADSPWVEDYTTVEAGVHSLGLGHNGVMYAGTGTNGRIYQNTGSGWVHAYDTGEDTFRSILSWGDYTYFGSDTDGVIYRTNGTSVNVTADTVETGIYCFEPFGSYLYAGTSVSGKILRSSDGVNWSESADLPEDVVYSLKSYGGYLYAATGITPGRVYRSANGVNFTEFHTFEEMNVYALEPMGEYLFISTGGDTDEGNIYRTDGSSIVLVYETGQLHVFTLKHAGNSMYAGTDRGWIYRSNSQGNRWDPDFYTGTGYVYTLGKNETHVFAGTWGNAKLFSLNIEDAGAWGYGIQYPPHSVRFVFYDMTGQPIPDANVTAVPGETTLGGWSWLQNILGFNTGVDIGGTTLTGTTGSDGSISFLMIPAIQYTVTITAPGINHATNIYPKDTEYMIRIGRLPMVADFPVYNLTAESVNASHVRLQANYSDAGNATTGLTFYVRNATGVVYTTPITLTNGTGSAYYDVADTRGSTYRFGFNGTNTNHGNVSAYQGIDMKGSGPLVDFGWDTLWYVLISLGIMFLVGGSFGEMDVRIGGIIVGIFAGIFWYIGWLPAALGGIIYIVMFLAVIYYMRGSLKAVDA